MSIYIYNIYMLYMCTYNYYRNPIIILLPYISPPHLEFGTSTSIYRMYILIFFITVDILIFLKKHKFVLGIGVTESCYYYQQYSSMRSRKHRGLTPARAAREECSERADPRPQKLAKKLEFIYISIFLLPHMKWPTF